MNREDAISWLRSVGRNAYAREWAFGDTIGITVGEPTLANGISVYPSVVYLYPREGQEWALVDFDLPDPAETFDSLERAARGAHEYVARKERELAESE